MEDEAEAERRNPVNRIFPWTRPGFLNHNTFDFGGSVL